MVESDIIVVNTRQWRYKLSRNLWLG